MGKIETFGVPLFDFAPSNPTNREEIRVTDPVTTDSSAARLKSFIERIEKLESEKADIVADIKDVYSEAKGTGFDVPVMRQIVRLRKMESADRQQQQELLDLYSKALGMLF